MSAKPPKGPKPAASATQAQVPGPLAFGPHADAAAKGDNADVYVLKGADVTSLSTAAIQKRLDHLVALGLIYTVDGKYYAVKGGDA